jgi:hemolysin III
MNPVSSLYPMMTATPPSYRPGEILVDRCLHWAGLAAGVAAIVVLIAAASNRGSVPVVSIVIYGAGLLAMLGCSALYHLSGTPHRKALFRRLDHAAIFLLIAATYTPFTLHTIGGAWGLGLFAFVWTVAATGIAVKLLRPGTLDGLSVAAYLLLGWSVLAAFDKLLAAASRETVLLLVAGGLLYTVGVLFHLWRRLPYQNAIWHGFVLAAAGCHYAAVVRALFETTPHI